ncbi:hypothetical protein JNUCC64_07305 [Streptomyces sp. JNUCC 64]
MRSSGRWASAVCAGAMALGGLVTLSSVSGGSGDDGVRTPQRSEITVDEAENRDSSPRGGSAPVLPSDYRDADAPRAVTAPVVVRAG